MTTPAKALDGNSAEWKEELDGQLEQAGDSLEAAADAVVGFIKEKPVLCLVGALAVGYLVGRIVRR
jgi:hypothetical protein